MQYLSTSLKNSISAEVTTLANCIKITRRDGYMIGFTEHDRDLPIEGMIYKSIAGFEVSARKNSSDMSVGNMSLSSYIYPHKDTQHNSLKSLLKQSLIKEILQGKNYIKELTDIELMSGKYDFAQLEFFTIDYENLEAGKIVCNKGHMGEVSLRDNYFFAELRGQAQRLSQDGICDVYSICCRVNLGDSRCGIDLRRYSKLSHVTTAEGRNSFYSKDLENEPDGWFNGGVIKWLTGNNKDISMEIKEFTQGRCILALPMGYAIKSLNRFKITAGCDKSFTTCKDKFDNVINFRGEPDLSSVDSIKKRF